MFIRRVAYVLPILLLLNACAGMPSLPGMQKTPFVEADFAPYAGKGSATVLGTAVGRLVSGNSITCVGYPVYLAPVTTYDTEVIQSIASLDSVSQFAGPAGKYWKRSACDAEGKFTFRHVAAGNWYVLTSLEREMLAPTPGNLMATKKDGFLVLQTVTLEAGDNDVTLTTEDRKKLFMGGLF